GAVLLAACSGGGGGNSSPSQPENTAPPDVLLPKPAVALSPSSQSVHVGEPFIIEVISTDATSCAETTLGNVASNGNISEIASAGGRFTYTVTCTGAGGSTSQAATVVVPLPAKATSYENSVVDVAPAVLPLVPLSGGRYATSSGAQGYADFEQ